MIWCIGDLHFDYTKDKSMDVFGENWKDHEDKIMNYWKENVRDEDLVLLAGDTSWALKLEDSLHDLNRIDALPGKKCIIKGNHDYWWSTKSKLEKLNLETICFIHNKSYFYDGFQISGTRGWLARDSENFSKEDEKIFLRELNRLHLSLEYGKNAGLDVIVMLHYPPFNNRGEPNEFYEIMKEYKVKYCIYGHLHGEGHEFIKEGTFFGIETKCVSSDYLNFQLIKL